MAHRALKARCQAWILRGPRADTVCGRTAISVVTSPVSHGLLVCGYHRKAWLDHGLARIAYYDAKTESWP